MKKNYTYSIVTTASDNYVSIADSAGAMGLGHSQ